MQSILNQTSRKITTISTIPVFILKHFDDAFQAYFSAYYQVMFNCGKQFLYYMVLYIYN